MRAVRWDLYLEAGADFDETIEWDAADGTPEDIENWTGIAQVRQRRWREGTDTEETNPVLLSFTTGAVAPNPRLTIAAGTIRVQAGGAVLDALAAWRNPAAFDLKVTSDGTPVPVRLVKGRAILDARVSA